MTSRILVLHDTPSDLDDLLARRCPGAAIAFATAPHEVAPALHEHAPTCVLSIKHSQFPGPAHVPALRHPTVRWFHVGGSGYEHLGGWDPTRVTVTHSAGVLAPFLAEMTVAAMLSLAVGLPRYAAHQRERAWRPGRFRAVAGRTLLVVGVGRVGAEVAMRARGLGMRVIGVHPSLPSHPAVDSMHRPDELLDLLPTADVVSLHPRLHPGTVGMIGPAELAAMKAGALLLNSSRGAVVREDALADALASGHLGGAWLDVFEVEPLPEGSPLWALPNVLITPHCADQVDDFPARFGALFCDLRDGLLAGAPLPALHP